MIKPNQNINVKITSKNMKYYKSFGYDCKMGDIISVNAERLQHGSHYKIIIICDNCKQNEYITRVADYYKCHDENLGDFCKECRHIKIKKSCLKNFGYEHPLQNPDIYKKSQVTLKNNYGVEYALQSEEIKSKVKETTYKNYGVNCSLSSEIIKEKSRQTCIQKYGVEHAMKLKETQDKMKCTNIQKYGVEYATQNKEVYDKIVNTNLKKYNTSNPMKNSEIKQKAMNTMLNENGIKISKPQLKCGDMLERIYPNLKRDVVVGSFCLDFLIEINNCKIDVEYDGWYWHSSKESKRKDLIRDKILQKDYNIKTLRIRSAYLIPTEEQIKNAMNELIKENKNYTQIILSDWKDS